MGSGFQSVLRIPRAEARTSTSPAFSQESPVNLDTQVVELMGRHRLMNELLRDGLEVAAPVRDRGVDVIAYADLSVQVAKFSAKRSR